MNSSNNIKSNLINGSQKNNELVCYYCSKEIVLPYTAGEEDEKQIKITLEDIGGKNNKK